MADRRITDTCGREWPEGCKALDTYKIAGLNPVYDLWRMFPPLSQILSITFSWYNRAETRLWSTRWLMFWIFGVKFLSLPQPWTSVRVKWINRWVFYLSRLIPLTYTFPIFPLKRFTGEKIILFHTVWACSGSSLKLYDVYTEGNSQTWDSVFLMSVPDSLCIILYTHSALHIWYLRNIWDLHEHLK